MLSHVMSEKHVMSCHAIILSHKSEADVHMFHVDHDWQTQVLLDYMITA